MSGGQGERPYSNTEKLGCIERELRMRRSVYAHRVDQGKMTKAAANEGIRIMEAIRDDYAALAQTERLL